ncbi:MAG TPA: glycosyltransferase, partial [Chloroflexi bacterium]|nr:glycosyltransferase [Chloroflexota bacterium]
MGEHQHERELPFVSVIMPIRNEEEFIADSLGAVLAQDYPPDRMEVLIADGMSTDATRDIIAKTAAAHPEISVSVLDNPREIVPTAFNIALAQARGEVIVRVDGHTIIAP